MKILIIEDELHSVERLEKLIAEVAPEKKVVGKCKSVQQSLQWFDENEYPDLILSDVQLSDGLSFEIFSRLKRKVPVIFISAYDNYAVDAFKAAGVHYLLKPVKKEELREALDRYEHINQGRKNSASQLENNSQEEPDQKTKKYQERFIINIGKQIKLLHDTDIAYIYTESKVIYIVVFDNHKYIIDLTLEQFDAILNPAMFYRINRQFIVSMKSIKKMSPASKQRVELKLEPNTSYETITSFERTPAFKKWLLGQL